MGTARVIIVGASHASAQMCASLRQDGWTGEILLLGDEPGLPYQRPPLSKAYLAGKLSPDELLIRKPDFYLKQEVRFRPARVVKLHPDALQVELEDGEVLDFDHLALCLGARPRRLSLPGAHLNGVHYLRGAADIQGIQADLPTSKHAVIIGGGYIGLETAASLRQLGLTVTVLETAGRVLQRVTAPEVSTFYERIHREEGIDLRTDVEVLALEGGDRVRGVLLAGDEVLQADLAIVGIGVVPNVELAQEAGLAVSDGIVIDGHGQTDHAHIYAAGDCANYFDARYGRRLRLESVPNAVEQAKTVAATICGKDKEISGLPWFWSDQYDLKLQIAGLSAGYEEVVLRGDPSVGRDFACFYLNEGRIIAADCVNRPQEFMFSKRAIGANLAPQRKLLADPDTALASLLQVAESAG
ncbi:NAD(P)/FAD-dependent oxidoreductase [Nocardioides terrigena]|uniref:NAD(P)/FAD-dependent oxidoreductase n=1 Tax=Nocardioides terrigena TaxID=424797 RepID=UPI000D3129B1|nr:FAD-dependent oxidoreductase [Nocardioides terrigena]